MGRYHAFASLSEEAKDATSPNANLLAYKPKIEPFRQTEAPAESAGADILFGNATVAAVDGVGGSVIVPIRAFFDSMPL